MLTRFRMLVLAAAVTLLPCTAPAYGYYDSDNPFVEAMLRMMELFGFIDRDRLPLGVPYLPATGVGSVWNPATAGLAGAQGLPGLGGGPLGALGAWPGVGGMGGGYPLGAMGGLPGLGGGPLAGMGAVPGMPGASPWPGMQTPAWPGTMPFPGSGIDGRDGAWSGTPPARVGLLDGIWETNKGGVLIIRADAARLYLSRERHQDFIIRYDHDHIWWQPRDGSKSRRYRYEMREGRMILADANSNLLLLRRRR